MEYNFNDIWALLKPKTDYDQLKRKCRLLWNSFSLDLRRSIYERIEKKKKRREFVDYNPLWAIQKNENPSQQQDKLQKLSFDEYYKLFGTTEEQNGWRRVHIPELQKTIYVKQN